MAVVQLASASDVAAALGRALTSSEAIAVEPMLDKASEAFRARALQTFTTGTSTVRLKVNGGRVHLREYPVTTVTSVVDDDDDAALYTLFGQWITLDPATSVLSSSDFVTVAYAHGSATAPDEVRLAVANMCRRILDLDPRAKAGFTQFSQTRGPLTDAGSLASWATGGEVRMSPDDNAIADTYRVAVPTVWIGRAS